MALPPFKQLISGLRKHKSWSNDSRKFLPTTADNSALSSSMLVDPYKQRGQQKAYKYEPLETEDSIRLLRLTPANEPTELLKLQLETVLLASMPKFYAISYAWGVQRAGVWIRDFIPVHVFDATGKECGTVAISHNLSEGLRAVRKSDEEVVLWADQICIDQDNVMERNHQVKLMDSIYSGAENVLVWLGADRDGFIRQAFSVARRLASDTSFANKTARNIAEGSVTSSAYPLRALTQFEWFQRTWTMQEVGLAFKATVLGPDSEIDWETLFRAYSVFANSMSPATSYATGPSGFRPSIVVEMHDWRNRPTDMTFLDLLASTRRRKASDFRDKVFALLAHSTAKVGNGLIVEPDYSKTVQEVYAETAMAVIATYRNLDVLSHASGSTLRSSWIPVWHNDFVGQVLTSRKDFQACGPPGTYFSQRLPTFKDVGEGVFALETRGLLVGKVVWLHQGFSALKEYEPGGYRRDDLDAQSADVWESMRGLRQTVAGTSPLATCADLLGLACRTFTGGMIHPQYRNAMGASQCEADFREYWKLIWKRWPEGNIRWRQSTSYMYFRAALRFAGHGFAGHGKRYFCTDTGYFGLGPNYINTDCRVYILESGRIPLALKPSTVEGSNTYTLVGECYIDGVMFGDMVTENAKTEDIRVL